jgi:alkylation response protein AidB-like acyl-CoA dehydrogenase
MVGTRSSAAKARYSDHATMHDIGEGTLPGASCPSPESTTLVETAAALRPIVRSFQDDAERERRIPLPLVEQLRAAGLYRMLVPRELGGLQVDLLTFLRAVELISEGDGSAGWNLANNAICQLMALSLPDAGVEEVFDDDGPDTIIAGTGVPGGGTGVAVDGGYVVSGRWPFGSGCRESQWMVANFDIAAGDHPRQEPDGTPALHRAFFRAAECSVFDTWDMTGMRGTGSHDWAVANVFVPERRTVHVPGRLLFNQWQRWNGVFYELPVHAVTGAHHSVVATGIARAGIEALTELAGGKVRRGRAGLLAEQVHVQESIARAEALLGSAQTYRTAVTTEIWDTVAAGQPTTLEQRARCRLAASFAVDNARQAIELMFRAGGTTSTQRTHQLAHCWRDLYVVGQSAGVSPEWYSLTGRAFLGMDPRPRLS